ncbi:hypothetical protein BDZ88DRAFT_285740 [Geranomyces variabilis]|nr:hypothetical protein BDZ88DRAFT_285740 [Geranomyces variabilis]KAJ3142259.1 hypothetical protein HDU90_004532 [Geranomyces variabilis]
MPVNEKLLKKVIKEGGKRGVEIEGAATMGGLEFFCTKVDEPEGDVNLLLESVKAWTDKKAVCQRCPEAWIYRPLQGLKLLGNTDQFASSLRLFQTKFLSEETKSYSESN